MDKTEALGFIGLKEPISEEALYDKYMERFNYFKMLYLNAPNKAVEQIHQQNLQKLDQVKNVLSEEITAKKKKFDKKYVDTVPKPNSKLVEIRAKPIVGWLIVHAESKKAKTFELYEGLNYIGRKKKYDKANSIILEDDRFVSGTHAFIKCTEAGGKLQYLLYDGDGIKPSVNGVFLNGNDVRIDQYCLLRENDTVQIGKTKLVFKIKKIIEASFES